MSTLFFDIANTMLFSPQSAIRASPIQRTSKTDHFYCTELYLRALLHLIMAPKAANKGRCSLLLSSGLWQDFIAFAQSPWFTSLVPCPILKETHCRRQKC